MPFGLGTPELIIILVIVLLIFGIGRLPEVGGAMGKGLREFKRAVGGGSDSKSNEDASADNGPDDKPDKL